MYLARTVIDLFFGHARFVGFDAVEVDGKRLRFREALAEAEEGSLVADVPGLAEAGFMANGNRVRIATGDHFAGTRVPTMRPGR